MIRTITRKEVQRMKLRGKPRCLACGTPLTFIYEGSTGYSGEKCPKCKQEYLINTETLEVIKIENAS